MTEANNGSTIAMTYNAMGLRAGYTVTPYGVKRREKWALRHF